MYGNKKKYIYINNQYNILDSNLKMLFKMLFYMNYFYKVCLSFFFFLIFKQFSICIMCMHLYVHRVGKATLESVNLKGSSFLTLKDFNAEEIKHILWVSADLKHRIKHRGEVLQNILQLLNLLTITYYTILTYYFFLFLCTVCPITSRQIYCHDI